MEELIRDRIHEALELEPTPPSLRSRVMDSLPVAERRGTGQPPRLSVQWAAGAVATLLAIAIIAGFLLSRGLTPVLPVRHNPAPPVGLVSPEGVVVGPDGSVYLSDFLGDRVFRIRPNGSVVVYAGGGSGGDGPATRASLFHPAGLALDGNGNLYIADTPGGTIRKVDVHGNLSTVPVDSGWATFSAPTGLAVDSSGVLWVSNMYGAVGTVSGPGVANDGASLPPPHWVPGYITFDTAGNLYVADRAPGTGNNPLYTTASGGGCRIVRMSPDRRLSVIAGTGVCGFSGDGGPAKTAQINDPNGIAFDSAGNLYFADANNHRIRRIDTAGIITTVAGTGAQGFNDGPAEASQLQFPFGMAISPNGLLYFADMTCQCWLPTSPGRLRTLNLATGMVTTVMTGQTPIAAT